MAARAKTPRPPEGTGATGAELWHDVLSRYELDFHEITLLREAVRCVDQLDTLAAAVAADGAVRANKVHPALVESRQLRIALARLLGALRLPAGDEDDQAAGRRPQRRIGVRGVHQIRGA